MERPYNLTFRGLEKTPAIEALVDKRVHRLERHCDHIIGVDVAIEQDQKEVRGGSEYRARVQATVPPGHEVVGKTKENDAEAPVPLEVAVTNAFDNVERQLDKLVAKQRGDVKHHPAQEATGTVTQLNRPDRYGFLLADDGRQIYFRDSAVAEDRFDELEMGASVNFAEEPGDEGPQASTVRIVDPRGLPT